MSVTVVTTCREKGTQNLVRTTEKSIRLRPPPILRRGLQGNEKKQMACSRPIKPKGLVTVKIRFTGNGLKGLYGTLLLLGKPQITEKPSGGTNEHKKTNKYNQR